MLFFTKLIIIINKGNSNIIIPFIKAYEIMHWIYFILTYSIKEKLNNIILTNLKMVYSISFTL